MGVQTLDARGLKCPQPTLKVTAMSVRMKPGDVLEIVSDCTSFEEDLRDWCLRFQKILLWMKNDGSATRCQIQF